MRHKFRLGRGARLLPVLGTTLALAAIPSVASASSTGATAPGFDPQTTNVPYLAWNGEQVRLEKCVPADGLSFQEFNQITSITSNAARARHPHFISLPKASKVATCSSISWSPEW